MLRAPIPHRFPSSAAVAPVRRPGRALGFARDMAVVLAVMALYFIARGQAL